MHSKLLFQLLCTLAVAQMLSLSTTFCQKKKKKKKHVQKGTSCRSPNFLSCVTKQKNRCTSHTPLSKMVESTSLPLSLL